MGITYNHSNYESKRYTPRLHPFSAIDDSKLLTYNMLHCSSRSFNLKLPNQRLYEIIRVAVLTNYRFLTKPSWDLALTLQRIYENCRISRLETLFKSRSKPDSGTGICTSVGQATVVDLTGSN